MVCRQENFPLGFGQRAASYAPRRRGGAGAPAQVITVEFAHRRKVASIIIVRATIVAQNAEAGAGCNARVSAGRPPPRGGGICCSA